MSGLQFLGMILALAPSGLCLLAGIVVMTYVAYYRVKDENDWSAAILEIIILVVAISTGLGCYLWKYGG